MTREEQIVQAGIEYTIKTRSMCIGGNTFSELVDKMNRNSDFEEGAKWADNHPVNVWHDTSEEPRFNQWFLAQIGDNAFDTFIMAMDKNKEWKEWSNGINIKRWAYISDLLPKGGKK